MHASTVILIAFFTSAVTATGTVLVLQKAGVIGPPTAASAASEAALVVVPDFTGITEADARANAAVSHVAVLVAGREGARGRRSGTVVRQSIPPGQRVPKDHPVSVVLADELPPVPKVVGLTAADATLKLEQAGFKVSTGPKVPDATVPDGAVIAQTPGAEEALEKGGSVVLRVSAGPAEVEVPRVTGSVVQRAKTELEKLGLKPKVEWVSVAESQGLIVLRQTPPAGQKAKPGSEVTIVANQ
jgi:eukaryotic-like serine/threonine-protein kinase